MVNDGGSGKEALDACVQLACAAPQVIDRTEVGQRGKIRKMLIFEDAELHGNRGWMRGREASKHSAGTREAAASESSLLFLRGFLVAFVEALDPTGRVKQLLLARVKRVAIGADFHL